MRISVASEGAEGPAVGANEGRAATASPGAMKARPGFGVSAGIYACGMGAVGNEERPIPTEGDKQIEAGPLLEHVRWVLDDLAARIESFNQRAGVLLAASIAIVVFALPAVAGLLSGPKSWIGVALVEVPFIVPVVLALLTLGVRSEHGIGPVPIVGKVDDKGVPKGASGTYIERDLLVSLTGKTTTGRPSVLDAMNEMCDDKARLLRRTQYAFVGSVVASVVILAVLKLVTSW